VQIYALNKPPGLGLATHLKIYKLFRQIKPTVLHSYNLSSIEYTLAATLAGVPVRVHAEHGRDASDPDGKNWKHNLLRKLMCPLVDTFVPVSGDLQRWLKSMIGVPDSKNLLINNGVDIQRFQEKTYAPVVDAAFSATKKITTTATIRFHSHPTALSSARLAGYKTLKIMPIWCAPSSRCVL